MKGLLDHGYPGPGEPIAIRGAGISGDGRVCDLNFEDIDALDNKRVHKNKRSILSKDRERYGTFPILGETKNE